MRQPTKKSCPNQSWQMEVTQLKHTFPWATASVEANSSQRFEIWWNSETKSMTRFDSKIGGTCHSWVDDLYSVLMNRKQDGAHLESLLLRYYLCYIFWYVTSQIFLWSIKYTYFEKLVKHYLGWLCLKDITGKQVYPINVSQTPCWIKLLVCTSRVHHTKV